MKCFVESKVLAATAYLIPCKQIVIFDDVLVCTDIEDEQFDFKLSDYEFLVFNDDPVE